MSRIRRITVRLNPDKVMDQEIIRFIETMDKSKFKTVNNAVISSIYDSICQKKDFVIGDRNAISDKLINEILSQVKSALARELPKFLISIYGEIIGNYNLAVSPVTVKSENGSMNDNDVDLDFLGG